MLLHWSSFFRISFIHWLDSKNSLVDIIMILYLLLGQTPLSKHSNSNSSEFVNNFLFVNKVTQCSRDCNNRRCYYETSNGCLLHCCFRTGVGHRTLKFLCYLWLSNIYHEKMELHSREKKARCSSCSVVYLHMNTNLKYLAWNIDGEINPWVLCKIIPWLALFIEL